MSQLPPTPPPQPFTVPPAPQNQQPFVPQASSNSNRSFWLIFGSLGAAGVLLLICVGVAVIGTLSLLGRQVSTTFAELDNPDLPAADVQPTALPIDPGTAIQLGNVMEVGDFDVTITSVRSDLGTPSVVPAEGNEFLYLDMNVTNRSRRSRSFDEVIYATYIQDATNRQYFSAHGLESNAAFESIKRDGTLQITVAYEVPRDIKNVHWVYEDTRDDVKVAAPVR